MRRIWAPALLWAGGAAAVTAVALRDPHVPGSWGSCGFLTVTGFYCPGCGGLRAMHDLTHGHVLAALQSNAMGLVLCAVLGGLLTLWLVCAWQGRQVPVDRIVTARRVWVFLAVFAIFAVYRNTPWGAWLAPPLLVG